MRNPFPLFFIPIHAFLFYPGLVYAQEKQADVDMDRIEVVESKKNQETDANRKDKTGFHSTIRLEEAKERHDTLPQILERESGLRVRQFGGLGSYSTLSIRGTNPNQSRFYVDGIPFNNSQTGEVNLADLPFDNLEEVEVYRSGVPIGFAGSAIGGIVNLKTMKPTRERTRINVGGGSFGTGRASVSHSGLSDSKEMGYTVFGIGEKSDQNFPFLNDNGTLFNPLDDGIVKRKNSQFERAQGTGNLFWNAWGTEFRLLADLNHRRHGVAGIGNNQTEKTQRKYSKLTTALTTDTKEFLWENLQLESRIYFTGFRDEFFDPRSEFSSGRPNSLTNSDNPGFQLTPTLWLLDYYQVLKFSASVEREDFRRDRRNADHRVLEKEPVRNRRFRNLQVQDEIRLFESRLLIVPGVHWDEYRDTWENDISPGRSEQYFRKTTRFTNPRLGILWKILDGGNHRLQFQANAAKQARMPMFLELFGERGQIIGNPNLDPERGENLDAGFTYRGYQGGWEWTTTTAVFRREIQDMILFIPNSQFTLQADNVDSARIDGWELSQKVSYKNWKLIANYTYQRAINTSDSPALKGKYLPLRPMHEFFTSLSYRYKRWTTGVEFTYIGAVFRDRTNEYINYLPARDIYGAFLSYVFWKNDSENSDTPEELRFNFEMKNIGDRQFADFVGFPLPGRMWFAGVSYVF